MHRMAGAIADRLADRDHEGVGNEHGKP
jgi:hypothetical protein